ncbi:MAG: histone deacetylase family protein [Vicinamibacterales bacterium]
MRVVYSERYHIDIGAHVFPTIKYRLVHRALASRGGCAFVEPSPASWEDLALVHTAAYLKKTRTGDFTLPEMAQLELPWTPEIVEGFRLMTGGTLLAARHALEPLDAARVPAQGANQGVGLHLGGGFHHAFADHGEGFCLFNDVAVAIRVLQREGRIARAAVVDCDVHHGNGTAAIFDGDPSVFTFSIHQQANYPAFKPRGSLDIGVEDRVTDREYLATLAQALPRVLAFGPDVVFYLAGADPYEDDQLGGLALTIDGLRERDRIVFETCRAFPTVLTLAGGYARRIDDTVAIHRGSFDAAAAVLRT